METIHALVQKNDYQEFLLIITDVLKEGSYLLYTEGLIDILKEGFELTTIEEGFFLPGCLSRKKQVVPVLVDTIEGR